MQRLIILLGIAALAACQKPKSFDERYDATAKEIEQRAANLDEQVNQPQPANDQRM
jgi:hypothetical protein